MAETTFNLVLLWSIVHFYSSPFALPCSFSAQTFAQCGAEGEGSMAGHGLKEMTERGDVKETQQLKTKGRKGQKRQDNMLP